MLKMYSARNVNYECSAITVNFGTLYSIKIISHNQRKIITKQIIKTKTQQFFKNLFVYIQMRYLNSSKIND